ncbi:MAG: protein kinase domain-containing protein, partial [Planctomycetota bacterium]
VGRFEREAKAIAALRGKTPHVVQVYDYGWDREAAGYYITMEFVDGESLEGIRRRLGRLAPAVAVAAVIQAARALDVAHKLDLVHRDIKPDNLLLSADGTVKVADFGLVRRVDGSDGMTATGQALGTATFMAPEQAMGDHVDHRADLYSLGATLFALITGRPPHDVGGGAALFEALMHLATTPPPELEIEGDPVDPELNLISKRLLAKRPEERYGSAAEVVEALEAWAPSHGGLGDLSGLAQARELPASVPAAAPDPFADTRERPGTPSPERSAPIDLMIPTGAAGPSGSQGGRSLTSIVALLVALGAPTGIAIWAATDDQTPVGPGPNATVSRTAAPATTTTPPPPPATATAPTGRTTEERVSEYLESVAQHEAKGDWRAAQLALEAALKLDPSDKRIAPIRERLNAAEATAAEAARLRRQFEAYMERARPAQAAASTAAEWRSVLELAKQAAATAPDDAAKQEAAAMHQLAEDQLTWNRARQLDASGERAKAHKAALEAFAGRNAPRELQALRNKLAAALARWEAAQKAAATTTGDTALAKIWETAAVDAPEPADAEAARARAAAARSREEARTAFRDAVAAKRVPPKEGWTVDELRKRLEECETLAAALPGEEQGEARKTLQPLRRLQALHAALDRADGFIDDVQGDDARALLEPFLATEFADHAGALQRWKRAIEIEGRMSIDLGKGVNLVLIRILGPKGDEQFWMGRTEVTQGQWVRLEPHNPSEHAGYKDAEIKPVSSVTWGEASNWCKKLNTSLSPLQRRFWRAELPTRRRWQHAARGGIPAADYAESVHGRSPGRFAWHLGNSGRKIQPVGTRDPNRFGLHDMLGNVREFCSDPFQGGDAPPAHAICGGSILTPANTIRPGLVEHLPDTDRMVSTGFRVMLSER